MKSSLLLLTIALFLSGCGGGTQSQTAAQLRLSTNPSGLWLVSFLEIFDECDLLPEDTDFFEDEQQVHLDGETVSLTSLDLPLAEYLGETRGEDSFLASALLEGDLFGVGFNCALSEDIAYNNLTEQTATVLYHVSIVCDDGTRCDSTLRGVAEPLDPSESLLAPTLQ